MSRDPDRMVRTSVLLPQSVLDSLARRWPAMSQSERIRHALLIVSQRLLG